MIKVEPITIGVNIKKNDSPVNITISGFPPAGGWIVFVIIIKNIASPTPRPKENTLFPNIFKTINPDNADNKCPKKIFLGCAERLSCIDIIKTTVAPNGGISQI